VLFTARDAILFHRPPRERSWFTFKEVCTEAPLIFQNRYLHLLTLLVWHKCVFLRVSLNRLSVSYLIPLRAFQNVRETIFVLAMY